MLREDVLDAGDHVLCLRLCQLGRLRRAEERAALVGDLGDGRELLHEHVVTGGRRLGRIRLLRCQGA